MLFWLAEESQQGLGVPRGTLLGGAGPPRAETIARGLGTLCGPQPATAGS